MHAEASFGNEERRRRGRRASTWRGLEAGTGNSSEDLCLTKIKEGKPRNTLRSAKGQNARKATAVVTRCGCGRGESFEGCENALRGILE